MNKKITIGVVAGLLIGLVFLAIRRHSGESRNPGLKLADENQAEKLDPGFRRDDDIPQNSDKQLEKTKEEMLAQLNRQPGSARTLDLPAEQPEPAVEEEAAIPAVPVPTLSPEELARREGRKQRAVLPMGVVLNDRTPVYADPEFKKILFETMTGDLVRVFADSRAEAYHVQPGLDVFLAATTKKTEPAGLHLPDKDGWVKKSALHLFEAESAKEFLTTVDPVTLGNDTSFSTVDFYVRAMKNRDPVVHRVMGPRMVALVLLHEDYSTLWSGLYRDPDPKIRDAALAYLKERGVGNSRPIIEDLIKRLAELTQTRATGERELEVLSILSVLKESGHPRVPAAVASFAESWKGTQSDGINDAARQILTR